MCFVNCPSIRVSTCAADSSTKGLYSSYSQAYTCQTCKWALLDIILEMEWFIAQMYFATPAGKPFQTSSHSRVGVVYLVGQKTRLDRGPRGLGLDGPVSNRGKFRVELQCCRTGRRCHVLLMKDLEANIQTDGSWHNVQTCLGLFVSSRCWHVFGECNRKNTRMRCGRGALRGGE